MLPRCRKRPDWFERLVEAEQRLSIRRWCYGKHDCVQAALEVLHAMTDVDLNSQVARYGSRQAARKLVAYKLETTAIAFAAQLRLRRVDPFRAGKGAMLLVRTQHGGVAMGFINSRGLPAIAATVGLAQTEFGMVIHAWEVP